MSTTLVASVSRADLSALKPHGPPPVIHRAGYQQSAATDPMQQIENILSQAL